MKPENPNILGGGHPMEGTNLGSGKENENGDVSDVIGGVTGTLQNPATNGKPKYSNLHRETPRVVSENRSSSLSKVGTERSASLKKSKIPKDRSNRKVLLAETGKQSGRSVNISLPTKATSTSSSRKSAGPTDHPRPSGTEAVSPVSTGSRSSTSSSSSSIPRALTRVASADAKRLGVSSSRSSSTPRPSIQHHRPEKHGSMGASISKQNEIDVSLSRSTSTPRSSNRSVLSGKHGSLNASIDNRDSEGSLNTASTVPSRTSGGFVSRLEERAHKREEYYSKLREKNEAKELEKAHLQAKQEEAEIKQLRKNMVFKATPMPTFYQGPPPRQVELKKVLSTRAKSPKLGGLKIHVSTTGSASRDGAVHSRSSVPRPGAVEPSKQNESSPGCNGDSVTPSKMSLRRTSKMPISKPVTRPPTLKSPLHKPEVKPHNSKHKMTGPPHKTEKAHNEEKPDSCNESIKDFSPTSDNSIELDSIENTLDDDESILNLPDPEDPPDTMSTIRG